VKFKALAAVLLSLTLSFSGVHGGEPAPFFQEDFADLNNWTPLHFPKIKEHTLYSVHAEGGETYLKAVSRASASALVCTKPFNVYEHPIVTWRWKIDNVYVKGDATGKAGDDYPLRVYIAFAMDPKEAGLFERLKYKSAKMLYGHELPHTTVNYIWANKKHDETILTSTYTERSKLILLQQGAARVGTWQTEEIDILTDYEKAFGKKPPALATLAIMNDSDNTGESSVSYIDYIHVYSREAEKDDS
jgi:hypothetical protein